MNCTPRAAVPLAAFLLAAATSTGAPAVPAAAARYAVEEVTMARLGAALAAGEVTSRQLVDAYLARIAEIDDRGPTLGAVVEVNPDARAIADALDRELRERGPRGPLHGIPVLLKDNIDTADGMETTAGSLALVGSRPARDAFVVERLRAAGAVVLGKTNLSEWANFRSTRSSSGWSARGGQTRNPYALDRNPSGSSSGSAAAVAASLAAAAIGTETDGSILSPASVCGIVGIKPTVGLVSRSGIIPIAHSQDTAGPMARTVADAAALLGPLTGSDPRDPATRASAGMAADDYGRFLDPQGLAGARLGVVRAAAFRLGPKTAPVLEAAIGALRAAGATVVEVELASAGKTDEGELEVLLYEFKADLEAYLGSRPGAKVKSLAGLIEFNRRNAPDEMPFFEQELLEMADKKGPLTEKRYRAALRRIRSLSRTAGIDAVMDAERLDALVAITNGPAHLTDLVNGDAFTGGSESPAAVAGYPSISVPAGHVHGLPVGLSFFGRAWTEPTLIRLAYAFEQATKARRPPEYRATLDLTAPEAAPASAASR
jgi:amidase